jgi:predicted nuclease with RNAse H fold
MRSAQPTFVAGIDVSATRGLDAAILTLDGSLVQTAWLPGLDGLRHWLDAWAERLLAVAVDAPGSRARAAGGREAERVLKRLGLSLYLAPTDDVTAASWMVEGWAVFRLLAEHGFPEARRRRDELVGERHALECFPYAAYVAWSGARRPTATEPAAWARRVLARRGYRLPGTAKDAPDAVAAALTALAWTRGEADVYGDPEEGVIWTPCSLPEPRERPGNRPLTPRPPLPQAGEGEPTG